MSRFIDITGGKFYRLTAIRVSGLGTGRPQWLFKCDCGNYITRCSSEVKSGHTKSCGCWKKDIPGHKTHGQSNKRIYQTYNSMKRRCYDDNPRYLKHYRDKGIKVCDEWMNNPQAFFDWAFANGYAEDLTIDRINSSKGYCPDNCEFITQAEQARRATIVRECNRKNKKYEAS